MAETQTEPDISYIASVTRIRAAAGVILRDQAGRVLVVHPTYKDVWEVPGGMVEPDESPADAYTRDIRGELGLSVPAGALLCVDGSADPGRVDGTTRSRGRSSILALREMYMVAAGPPTVLGRRLGADRRSPIPAALLAVRERGVARTADRMPDASTCRCIGSHSDLSPSDTSIRISLA